MGVKVNRFFFAIKANSEFILASSRSDGVLYALVLLHYLTTVTYFPYQGDIVSRKKGIGYKKKWVLRPLSEYLSNKLNIYE